MCTLDIILQELKKQHKSQKQLAEHLGMSKNAISEWKSGRNESYKKYLPEIADFLEVSVSYLSGETDNPNPGSPIITDDDLKFALFNGAEGVTDEMFEEVKRFAEMVKLREDSKKK